MNTTATLTEHANEIHKSTHYMMYNELFSSVFPVEFKGLFGDIRKMI
jgi:hypothetical protein